jgi:uncharacterized protein YndB with AHSA1/START domain
MSIAPFGLTFYLGKKNRMNQVTVKAEINASIQDVWEKWTQPAHVMQWNNASDDWHCPSAENDLREGGAFTFVMAAKDGSMSFPFSGIYAHVELHKGLAYAMSDGRKVQVTFESIGNSTIVTEVFDPENIHPVDFQQAGWQAILNNFKSYAEK